VSNRLSDAIYMTKRVVARHPNVDLAAPYPRKLAFDGGEHMVIVKLGVQTGRHVALDRLYIMLKPTLYAEVQRAVLGDTQGKIDFGGDMARIDAKAQEADQRFQWFRTLQGEHATGSASIKMAKEELRTALADLRDELDRYLATEFGIDVADREAFDHWRQTHQPFHWFIEFYRIIAEGGFDAIIGNPPYVEMKDLKQYKVRGYRCLDAGNLYALVMERCSALGSPSGRQGFIVPVSSVSTERYASLQALLTSHQLYYSSFDDRPSRLFDGLEHIRLTIHLIGPTAQDRPLHSTGYNKWTALERQTLFQRLAYTEATSMLVEGTLPKLSSPHEVSILRKLTQQKAKLSSFYDKAGLHTIYYSRKVGYFLQILNFAPRVLDGQGTLRPPSEFKRIAFASEAEAMVALCCLNSNLFYWFVTVFSDCRHVNKREVDAFSINLRALGTGAHGHRLLELGQLLMVDVERNSSDKVMKFKHDVLTVYMAM